MIKPGDIRAFAGGRTVAYFGASIVVGLVLFCVEVGFAFGIQSFLLLLGIASRDSLSASRWIPHQSAPAVILAIFCLALVRNGLLWTQGYMREAAGERFCCLHRARVLQWAFHTPGVSSSRITSMFGERATQAGHWIRHVVTALNLSAVCVLLSATLFYVQPYITLATVAIVLALMAPVRLMNRQIRKAGKGVVAEWEATYRRLVVGIRNLLLLRIYGLERDEARQTNASLGSYLTHFLTYQRASGLFLILPQTVGVTLVCLLLLLAQTRLHLTANLLLVYFYLLVRLLQNAAPMGQAFANAMFQWPQVETFYDWWRTEYVPGSIATTDAAAPPAGGLSRAAAVGWHCERLFFAYPGATEPVFRGLSFDIVPGAAVVITGPSGVGKSTLLNLLLAELTPLDGRIDLIMEGSRVSLADNRRRLMPLVGYVGAESFLVDGTIRENLLYGVHHVPGEAELADALGKAECGFIDDLPTGLEHRLTDQGAGLSSGQKQRLSLARALLRRPSVLVLDEATANLDVATEEKLVDTLTQLKGGMTIVAVTHRQALLRLADQVLTLAP